ncbi:MAG: Na(+)-translocating NADH-quinone reductase subunit A, partial [Muribaculaceae bacterium]|nr:Na(+)-translocating NADH-quinone reductase subunit A [Muribaculaceae bacterium]
MEDTIKIKKGLDIPMFGAPSSDITTDTSTMLFAICPDDFPGIVWKARVHPGDKVQRGSILFADKDNAGLCLTSPVSGEVTEIARGERRHILHITIRREGNEAERFEIPDNVEGLRAILQASGLWAMIRQRPFDIVPGVNAVPRDIFVTAFDSAPLAAPMLQPGDMKDLEAGLAALAKLTSGTVYLGVRPDSGITSKAAKVITFEGPHPAGNVGTQIAAISPVNKGETVFTLDARTAVRIGCLTTYGVLDTKAIVAVTGPEVSNPHLINTTIGARLDTLLAGSLKTNNDSGLRIISGNVLTGVRCSLADGFLHFPYRQITVIDDGADSDEFMGWASMSPNKFSVKRTFPAWLKGLNKPFRFDARIKGGRRAMILSEEFDKVFPFDIYPEYLLKAMMANDIERMEELGIYEVAPEDFALPEFVDTSKEPLQQIVRQSLDSLRKE